MKKESSELNIGIGSPYDSRIKSARNVIVRDMSGTKRNLKESHSRNIILHSPTKLSEVWKPSPRFEGSYLNSSK